jgi:antitoxin component YwqK of YwqJK toxin-antitoxin module
MDSFSQFLRAIGDFIAAIDVGVYQNRNSIKGDIEVREVEYEIGYSRDGEILFEVPLRKGKRDGIMRVCDEDGQVACEIPFVRGRVDGIVREYYEDGSIRKKTLYANGKKIR